MTTSNELVIKLEHINNNVTLTTEEHLSKAGLIRIATASTEHKTPIEIIENKPVHKSVRTTLYNCKTRLMLIATIDLLGPDDVLLMHEDVMKEANAIPGALPDKELDFICSKPAKLNQEKLI